MSSSYKPENYNSVSPYLIVENATETIEFLKCVFAALEIRRFSDPQGKIVHAEVRIDDTVLMIADCSENWPAIPANVHVYVSDVDETYRRAISSGASSIQEPVRKDDDDKRGGIRDAGGTTWWIATKIS